MDKLLKDAPDSIVARDLARVYLLVIAAGYRGKYRPFGLTRALAEYRQRLYEYIHNDDALMLYAPERKIFPEAVSQTMASEALRRFSTAQRWTAILLVLLIGYTVIAHIAWNSVSADLKDVTARIKSGMTAGAR
jgi:type VI protein secretion system component VasF